MGKRLMTPRTKFVVPIIPNATVVRLALLARLDAEPDGPLIVLAAAPGSGKTSLLSQWVGRLDGPVAWLSCTTDDAEPMLFWRDVDLAIREAWGSVGWTAPDPVDEHTPQERAIDAVNDLGRDGASGVIVVDDFHIAAPGVAAMTAFVEALPRGVRLVLGTRADPSFPLGRLRVQGRLMELREVDLRLTLVEMSTLLAGLGVGLSEVDLKQLDVLTEGWATGVHLAGLSLRATPRHAGLMQRLLDTDRSLVDFLMNEVIDLQPPERREFLMSSAELETFDAALCDAALGRDDGADMLQQVRAANLFLVEVDGGGGWYRYQPLFADFLRARLRATSPQHVPLIHRAAADAFASRDDLMSSVRQSMLAGDTAAALDRLTTSMTTATSIGDQAAGDTVARAWLREHGEVQLVLAPAAVVGCVIALEATGSSELGGRWLQRLEARQDELDATALFLLHGAWSLHLLNQGDPTGAFVRARAAEAVIEAHEVDSVWVSTLPMTLVQAQLWLGDPAGALATIADARRGGHPVISEVRAPGYASLAEFARGELTVAETLAARAETAADSFGLPDTSFGRAEPALALALLAIERREFDDAEVHIDRLMRIVDNGRRPLVELAGTLTAARLASARGDRVVVRVHLDRGRRILPAADPAVRAHLDRVELRLDLEGGELAAAARSVSRSATLPCHRPRFGEDPRRRGRSTSRPSAPAAGG